MSKAWKIVWSVVGVLAVLVVVVVGIIVYFGGKLVADTRAITQEVYGGPLPVSLMPVLGWKLSTDKLAVLMDTSHQTALILYQTPPLKTKAVPLSEPDVKKAMAAFDDKQEIQILLTGAHAGTPSSLTLNGQTVHTVKFTGTQGKPSEAGVLNLDKGRMLFVAIPGEVQTSPKDVASVLMGMPALKNDSHFASHAKAKEKAL